ncbi:heterokaryon incompatibility, partial [Lepidopterella palustris CBS 459.81]
RLCETRDLPPTTPYATLSYCWGRLQFFTLNESNYESMLQRINVSKLTKTFREAMETAKRLEVWYIWIDSLCIIQDSQEDWRIESALMGQVYEHSHCNIAASKAENGGDGCFTMRKPFSIQPFRVQREWNCIPRQITH